MGGARSSLVGGARAATATGRGNAEAVGGEHGLGHLGAGSGQTGLRGWDAGLVGDGLSFSLEAELRSAGAEDGVRALRWSPGLSICREDATGLEGSEEEPLAGTGRGSCVGFRGDGCPAWRVFLAVGATHFLGKVGVEAGEAA